MLHPNNTKDIARTKGIAPSSLLNVTLFRIFTDACAKYMTFHGQCIAFTLMKSQDLTRVEWHSSCSAVAIQIQPSSQEINLRASCVVSHSVSKTVVAHTDTLTHSQKRKMLQNHCSLNHVSLRIFPFFLVPTGETSH